MSETKQSDTEKAKTQRLQNKTPKIVKNQLKIVDKLKLVGVSNAE